MQCQRIGIGAASRMSVVAIGPSISARVRES